jgi:hypothetical protein
VKQKSMLEKCRVNCPEDNVDTELLLEWQEKDGKKLLNSIRCDNPKLMDLNPEDCQWSCWEEIEKDNGESK